MGQLVLNFSELNERLKELGIPQFPMNSLECHPNNPDEVEAMIRRLGDVVAEWIAKKEK